MKMLALSGVVLTSVLLSPSSLADWPTFSYPTLAELQAAGDIDTVACPTGQGQIKPGTVLPVKFISKNQQDWRWDFQGNSGCLALDQPLPFNDFSITHVNDPIEHLTLYSIVNAHYQSTAGRFKFVFTTPQLHWFCAKFSGNIISCANDI